MCNIVEKDVEMINFPPYRFVTFVMAVGMLNASRRVAFAHYVDVRLLYDNLAIGELASFLVLYENH